MTFLYFTAVAGILIVAFFGNRMVARLRYENRALKGAHTSLRALHEETLRLKEEQYGKLMKDFVLYQKGSVEVGLKRKLKPGRCFLAEDGKLYNEKPKAKKAKK